MSMSTGMLLMSDLKYKTLPNCREKLSHHHLDGDRIPLLIRFQEIRFLSETNLPVSTYFPTFSTFAHHP